LVQRGPGNCWKSAWPQSDIDATKANEQREEIAMKAALRAIGGGLIAVVLSAGSWAVAQTGPGQAQGGNAPAVPSQAPASQAKPPMVEQVPGASGQAQSGAKEQKTGTQQAVPSQKPASQSTPEAVSRSESTTK
jgi:hypothetical protein